MSNSNFPSSTVFNRFYVSAFCRNPDADYYLRADMTWAKDFASATLFTESDVAQMAPWDTTNVPAPTVPFNVVVWPTNCTLTGMGNVIYKTIPDMPKANYEA